MSVLLSITQFDVVHAELNHSISQRQCEGERLLFESAPAMSRGREIMNRADLELRFQVLTLVNWYKETRHTIMLREEREKQKKKNTRVSACMFSAALSKLSQPSKFSFWLNFAQLNSSSHLLPPVPLMSFWPDKMRLAAVKWASFACSHLNMGISHEPCHKQQKLLNCWPLFSDESAGVCIH